VVACALPARRRGPSQRLAIRRRCESIHPGAVGERSRNWTYLGDTVRIAFRNAMAVTGERQRYTVCYTRNRSLACRSRTLRGRAWDAWRLRIMPVGCGPWQQWFGTQPCRSTASSPGPMTRWTGCPTTSRKSRTRVSGSSSSESGFGGRARPRARYEDPKQGPDSCLSARQLCASERQLPAVLSGFER
jgi:hypothetical protein